MLLVVFGAGASFDSASSYPFRAGDGLIERPPLANQLFDDRPRFAEALQNFPECQPLIPRLRHPSNGATVEQLLQMYQLEANEYPPRHKQLAAIRYYLHLVLWDLERYWEHTHRGITNYKTLLDDIEKWRAASRGKVCLVTFNYDTMLESALPVLGINVHDLSDYLTGSYTVVKVHGSVNWAHEIDSPVRGLENGNAWEVARELIQTSAQLTISKRYRMVTQHPIAFGDRVGSLGRVALFPALAIPVVQKSAFECPDEQLQALRRDLGDVDRIITVGWRAAEQHFLDLLRERGGPRAHLMVVASGSREAQEIGNSLISTGIGGRSFVAATDGFTEVIRRGDVESFLQTK